MLDILREIKEKNYTITIQYIPDLESFSLTTEEGELTDELYDLSLIIPTRILYKILISLNNNNVIKIDKKVINFMKKEM